MITNYKHKGLERFALKGDKSGINAEFAEKLEVRLSTLDAATGPSAMQLPGWDCHPLKGDLAGHYGVKVSGNWRLTFKFEGENAEVVDLQDYH